MPAKKPPLPPLDGSLQHESWAVNASGLTRGMRTQKQRAQHAAAGRAYMGNVVSIGYSRGQSGNAEPHEGVLVRHAHSGRHTSSADPVRFQRPTTSDGLRATVAKNTAMFGGQVSTNASPRGGIARGRLSHSSSCDAFSTNMERPSTAPMSTGTGAKGSPGAGPTASEEQGVQALREEVRRLQLALVDKYRGKSKAIGGCQFRAVSSTRRQGQEVPDKPAEAAALRTALKALKKECTELRQAGSDLQKQLSASHANHAALEQRVAQDAHMWSVEREQLRDEIDRVRAEACADLCQLPDQSGALREARSQLKAVMDRLDSSEVLRKEANDKLSESQVHYASAKVEWDKTQAQMVNERQRLEGTVRALRDQLEALKNAHSENGKSLQQARKNSETEILRLQCEIGDLQGQLNELRKQLGDALKEAQEAAADLKLEREAHASSQTTIRALTIQINNVNHKLTSAHREMEKAKEDRLRVKQEAESLTTQLASAQEQVGHQKLRIDELSQLREAAERDKAAAQKELADAQRQHSVERAALDATIEDLKRRLGAAEACLGKEKDQRCRVEEHSKGLEKERDGLKRKLESQLNMHKKALESAMNSIVRLCVVAPTVNVHMGDGTHVFKAPMPQHKLKDFVEGQILPRFAQIFVQPEEGSDPDGEPLDLWLQALLVEMQGTIERHLTKLFAQVS